MSDVLNGETEDQYIERVTGDLARLPWREPYEVEIVERGTTVTLRCNRLIEGRTRRSDGTYRIRRDLVRCSNDAALRAN